MEDAISSPRVATAAPSSATDTAEPDPVSSSRRLVYLDGIRALAALYVVVHHIYITVYPGYPRNTGPWYLGWLMFGQFGVAVFIVVSGFSLALVPARHDYELTGGLRRFFSRRAWRILPPYWAAIVASVLLVMLVNVRMEDHVQVRGVIVNFFLIQDIVRGVSPNGAFWSIAVEWQLYFLFPLFLFARRHLGSAATAIGGAIGVWVVFLVATHVHAFNRLLHLTPQFAAVFIFGIVAAQATRPNAPLRRIPWTWLAIAVSLLVVGGCVLMGTVRAIGDFYWYDIAVGAAMAAALAALARDGATPLARLLERGPVVSVGHFSYSLYLTHAPILLAIWVFVVRPLHLAPLAQFATMVVITVPVCLAAAYGFFRLFERPFLTKRSFAAWVPVRRNASRPSHLDV